MNARKLPQQTPRVETGPVEFGDDWRGLFMRGDNCFAYALALRYLIEFAEHRGCPPLTIIQCRGLLQELEQTDERAVDTAIDSTEGAERG